MDTDNSVPMARGKGERELGGGGQRRRKVGTFAIVSTIKIKENSEK